MITIEQIEENFLKFKNGVKHYFGEEILNELISVTGGEEVIKNATFGTTADSGCAYNGSLIENILKIIKYACGINELLPEGKQVKKGEIYKIGLLSHIAKVVMFTKNDNDWEIKNRGIIYKFKELSGALRCGERSILIAMNAGIKFDAVEYEAMRIMDKTKDDDNYSKFYSSNLSYIIKQANELVMIENK